MEPANGVILNVKTANPIELPDLEVKSSSSARQRSGSASKRTTIHSTMSGGSSTSLPDVESISRENTVSGENSEHEEKQDEAPQPQKKVVKKLTEEQVTARIEEIVPRLSSSDDYCTAECTRAFNFLRRHSGHSFQQ